MHQPFGSQCVGALLAAVLVLPPGGAAAIRADGLSDPRDDASTWYTFAAERFSRSDGATALYEATRRQAGHASRRIEGARRAAVVDE